MATYIGITVLSVLCYKIFHSKKVYIVFMFTLMTILSGTRDMTVGVDTPMYFRIFYGMRDVPFDFSYFSENYIIEIGNRALIIIADWLFGDPQGYIFISAALTNLFMGYFVYKNSSPTNYWIMTFFFVSLGAYFAEFNGIRQSIGIAIASNSFQYLMERKLFKALLFVFCGMLFHSSISLFIPTLLFLYFVMPRIKTTRDVSLYLFYLIACLIVSVVGIKTLIDFFMQFSDKYQAYLMVTNSYSIGTGSLLSATFFKEVVICVAIASLLLHSSEFGVKSYMFSLCFFGVVYVSIYFMQTYVMSILFRVAMLFDYIVCLLLTEWVTHIHGVEKKCIVYVLMVVGGLIAVYLSLGHGFHGILQV